MQYSHIFFDWHGVLSHSRLWSHIQEKELIETALFGNLHHLLKEWLEGKCDVYRFVEALESETGLKAEYLLETLRQSCEQAELSSEEIPGLIARLRKSDIKCIISTDNFDVFDMWTVPALKLDNMFDGILNSYNIKHVKPEMNSNGYSPFFSPYFAEYGMTRALIIDDNDYSHIAKALGVDFKLVKPGDDVVALTNQCLFR